MDRDELLRRRSRRSAFFSSDEIVEALTFAVLINDCSGIGPLALECGEHATLCFGQFLFFRFVVVQSNEAAQLWFDKSEPLRLFRRHARRQSGFDDFTERAGVIVGDPARELQDLGTANRSLRRRGSCASLMSDFGEICGEFIEKADDVTSDEIASERDDQTRADFGLASSVPDSGGK